MNGISTEELAKRWGISRSRILLLAKEGRIQGARRVGRAWVFPADAEKPADKRTGADTPGKSAEGFKFPLYCFNRYTQEELETQFTGEEQALYAAEQVFAQQDYGAAYHMLEVLRKTATQLPVRAGALHYLCRTCLWLEKHEEYNGAYLELKRLLEKDYPYRSELQLLQYELDSYTEGVSCYTEDYFPVPGRPFHKSVRNYLGLISAFSELLSHVERGTAVHPIPYVLLCEKYEDEECFVSAAMLRMYIAAMFYAQGKQAECRENAYRSIALCLKCGCLWRISYLYRYIPVVFDMVLGEPGMEAARGIPELCRREYDLIFAQVKYMAGKSLMFEMKDTDFVYVYLAAQGLSNKEVADRLNRSVSTVSKRYSALYELTGAKNKKELAEKCMKALNEYGA